jgi:CMP/dCMP kinase
MVQKRTHCVRNSTIGLRASQCLAVAWVPVSGPGGEDQEEPRVLHGAHFVALGGVEHGEKAGASGHRLTARQVDLDLSLDDQDPSALVHLMLLELISGAELNRDRTALVLGIEDHRLAWLHVDRRNVPTAHGAQLYPRRMLIAIDGPAGAGKSTVARALARRLGITYLDSGAMYRSVALAALRRQLDLGDAAGLGELARQLEIELDGDRIRLGGEDVSEAIRTPEVTAAASRVSVHPEVREAMVERQRALIAGASHVAEGRDIGTVVSPDAPLKVFLTASDEERARRRAAETGEHERDVRLALAERDTRDRDREHGALRPATDAVELDTTGLEVDDVVDRIIGLASARGVLA